MLFIELETTDMTTFDRDTKDHGFLILSNGDKYDIYGDSVAEMKEEAATLADYLGVTVDCWNENPCRIFLPTPHQDVHGAGVRDGPWRQAFGHDGYR